MAETCECGEALSTHDGEHPGQCCDCFDASLGLYDDVEWLDPMPLVERPDA